MFCVWGWGTGVFLASDSKMAPLDTSSDSHVLPFCTTWVHIMECANDAHLCSLHTTHNLSTQDSGQGHNSPRTGRKTLSPNAASRDEPRRNSSQRLRKRLSLEHCSIVLCGNHDCSAHRNIKAMYRVSTFLHFSRQPFHPTY